MISDDIFPFLCVSHSSPENEKYEMKSDILIIVTMNYNYSNKPPTFLQIGRKSVVNKIDTSSFFAMKFDDIQMSLAQVLPTKLMPYKLN